MVFERVYVIYPSGERFGPADRATVVEWARQGRVPNTARIEDVETCDVLPVGRFADIDREIPRDLLQRLIPPNPSAVAGYYVSIFSVLGLFFCLVPGILGGLAAVVLGVLGLRTWGRDPGMGGRGHAWTAMLLGGLEVLGGTAVGLLILIN